MSEIANCPYCGEGGCEIDTWTHISGKNMYFVRCMFCQARGPSFFKKDRAIDAWNLVEELSGGHVCARIEFETDWEDWDE